MLQTWNEFVDELGSKLTNGDDPEFWPVAINQIFADAEFLCEHAKSKSPIFACVGLCSHWLSPHNNGSLLPDARYAWPSGYGGSGWSIFGLPEFDWSLSWQWVKSQNSWTPTQEIRGKRPLILRIAVPARTAKHLRAVVHTLWTPGSPTIPKEKFLQVYGFMKVDHNWECTSMFGREKPYEIS